MAGGCRWCTRDTSRAAHRADRLLLSGGSWTNALAGDLGLPLSIEREVLFWFDPVDNAAAYDARNFPIFCYEFTPGQISFGISRTAKGVKAGIHHSRDFVTRTADVKREVDPGEVDAVRESLRGVLPGLAKATVRDSGVCIYTNTPDDHFVVDWHPRHPNVLISSPCSGHGFKFASVLGEAQADMLITGKSAFDLAPFRIARFY